MNEKYIGKICPFCRTEFKESDQIVICSACDMPHHKECWVENQGCTTFGCLGTIQGVDFADNSVTANQMNYDSPTPVKYCTFCGQANSATMVYCVKCGRQLLASTSSAAVAPAPDVAAMPIYNQPAASAYVVPVPAAPAYVEPAPVYSPPVYAAPAYVEPAPIYAPSPVTYTQPAPVYAPPPVTYAPVAPMYTVPSAPPAAYPPQPQYQPQYGQPVQPQYGQSAYVNGQYVNPTVPNPYYGNSNNGQNGF